MWLRRQPALSSGFLRHQLRNFTTKSSENAWLLISRTEREGAKDLQSARAYVEALNQVGLGEKAIDRVMDSLNRSTTSSHPSHSSSTLPPLFSTSFDAPPHQHSTRTAPPNSSSSSPLSNGSPASPIHVITKSAPASNWEKFSSTFRFLLIAWLLASLANLYFEEIGRMSGRSVALHSEMDPSQGKKVTFDDVQGVDDVKEELQEIVDFLKNPDKFTKLGGKLPKGVLLTGPPGTGKTLLGRAMAGEAGVPFFHCSGSEFDEMFVGVGAKRVRELFAAAKKKSPCIVFIDEIDAVGGMRNPRDQQYAKMTLNQLLVEMDGFNQNEGIVVVGATNFPESLDKALVRPGRFDRNVVVDLPDVKGRVAILKIHSKDVPMREDVRFPYLARGTTGFSGADLANMVNQAALKAASLNKVAVEMKDLEWAKDKIIMGNERKRASISMENKRLVAYHEAGHALVAFYTPGSMPIHKATIMPRGQSLGMVTQLPENDDPNWTRKQLTARLDVAMGGRCSEELVVGMENVTSGASSDLQQATSLARSMITKLGMSEIVGPVMYKEDEYGAVSTSTRQVIESEICNLLTEAKRRASALLLQKRMELDRLAAALLEHETLSLDQIKLVLQGKMLPPTSID